LALVVEVWEAEKPPEEAPRMEKGRGRIKAQEMSGLHGEQREPSVPVPHIQLLRPAYS
ncbi:hypothetical protein Tco_0590113, partial [Tanacetum coccineum]